jgi:poly [ADP-ribose] polymerase 10/14/15
MQVLSVQRVQNGPMWQSYAVKRQSVLLREDPAIAAARFERDCLFHGTDEGTVDKIVTMGFNRSFCGKNATMYGKGVYFARDASYSFSPQCARLCLC